VFGTGFDVHDYLGRLSVTGRGGLRLAEMWHRGAEAYLGTTVAGFPNLYLMMGPNTGLGHNSMVYMIEAQARYALECIQVLLAEHVGFLDVRADVQARYNQRLQRRLARSVWASGCASWYLDEHGKNTTLWPGFTFEFRRRTRPLRRPEYVAGGRA
jgi:cation diffusion facilitator CzcD-associated flavoprotein CzcO